MANIRACATLRAMASKRFGAKGSRIDDARAAHVAALQKAGATVTRHQEVGSTGQSHPSKKGVIRIGRLHPIRQGRQNVQYDGALQVATIAPTRCAGKMALSFG